LSKDITDGMSAARLSNRHKAILQQQSATPHRSVLLKAQLGYADRGKPTFPCEGKRPLTKHGFKDASTDPRRITAWRHRRPHANIGMPTGERSGVFVLDVDRSEALEDLEREHGKLPETLTAETPSGGCHLYREHKILGATALVRRCGALTSQAFRIWCPHFFMLSKQEERSHLLKAEGAFEDHPYFTIGNRDLGMGSSSSRTRSGRGMAMSCSRRGRSGP